MYLCFAERSQVLNRVRQVRAGRVAFIELCLVHAGGQAFVKIGPKFFCDLLSHLVLSRKDALCKQYTTPRTGTLSIYHTVIRR